MTIIILLHMNSLRIVVIVVADRKTTTWSGSRVASTNSFFEVERMSESSIIIQISNNNKKIYGV